MKASILIVLTLILTACSSIPNPFQVDTVPVEKPDLVLPSVDEFNARNVEWIVITPENINTVWADLQDSGESVVIFALTADGYQAISLNMADIIKLVQQQKAIIAAYQKYYEGQQE